MARCRTLHEIAVTATFLQQSDDELTARYLDHEVVESWKAVQKHVMYQGRISEKPPTQMTQQRTEAALRLHTRQIWQALQGAVWLGWAGAGPDPIQWTVSLS